VTRASGALALALTAGTLILAFVPSANAAPEGIHKIQHVVMIMQENHSFDSYFGTYPGANGIPAGVCVPDPAAGGCVRPFHNPGDEVIGGPHGPSAVAEDLDGGRMDGFVAAADGKYGCEETGGCGKCKGGGDCAIEVMGYQDAREIPNYWTYAQNFVLQDDMFESSASWSLPEHLFLVSGWSARCPKEDTNPLDCVNTLEPAQPAKSWSAPVEQPPRVTYAWTDITHLMAAAGVSWRYYVAEGDEPDCEDDEAVTCKPVKQNSHTPGIWNELPDFTDVQQDGQLGNIQSLDSLYGAAHDEASCGLPNVSWVVPSLKVSEHPPSKISTGQTYVTTLINTIMRSPCWGSTAIFVSWDDWGGFYDHVMPPSVDENGYGLRVPGLVISPYAKTGYIDHQQLSHDAYLKFIEDDFLNGQRLNPATDGRPDPRPDVREEAPGLGDIANDFDFEQLPRPPLLLSAHPPPGPASEPPGGRSQPPTVSSDPPSSLTRSSATLNGIVNPNGGTISDCHFEYGTSVFYEASVPCSPMPEGGEALDDVSASIAGLSSDTSYHFRIVATNEHGTATGADQTFMTLPDPPTVTSVTPNAGLESGGATVTIDGTNLARVSSVHFGSAAATDVAVSSNSSLTAISPANAQSVDVTVTSPGGSSSANPGDLFLYVPKGPRPVITSVSPSSGPAAGGENVTITGTGFKGVTGLQFGSFGAGGFSVESPTSISVPSPASTAGPAHVTVTTPNGTSSETSRDQFRSGPPTVSSVNPSTGSTAGGTSVTIAGSGFATGAGLTTLRFGSGAGTSVECAAITTCTAVTPPHKSGTVELRAGVKGQTSPKEAPVDQFTYR
jgi:phospholipase C